MLVTEEVHEATADRVEFGSKFELELQGKDAHVVAYSVVGLSDSDPE
jgi:hypothetical protein